MAYRRWLAPLSLIFSGIVLLAFWVRGDAPIFWPIIIILVGLYALLRERSTPGTPQSFVIDTLSRLFCRIFALFWLVAAIMELFVMGPLMSWVLRDGIMPEEGASTGWLAIQRFLGLYVLSAAAGFICAAFGLVLLRISKPELGKS